MEQDAVFLERRAGEKMDLILEVDFVLDRVGRPPPELRSCSLPWLKQIKMLGVAAAVFPGRDMLGEDNGDAGVCLGTIGKQNAQRGLRDVRCDEHSEPLLIVKRGEDLSC